jgi:hypothetical protein
VSESVTAKGSIPTIWPPSDVKIEKCEGVFITKDNGGVERIDGVPQPDGTIKMRCGKFYRRMPNGETS